jgi:DNA (cytosine-5)-methyltransferase 1
MIRPQFTIDLHDELIVDNFAGGGGASTGIELALGRCVDLAVNHDPEAVAMHQANHPQTLHLCENVFDVDPLAVTKGRRVGLAWFSPDCTHFSKARGTKPRKKSIRGLAWVIIRWAVLVRPRVIMWENVEEFLGWGPLGADGQPCPDNLGRTFQTFKDCLGSGISPDNPDIPEILETLGAGFPIERLYASNGGLGYAVETREERACNHGAPTIRKRLFGIARCDGRPIVWPAPTHGDPKRKDFKRSGLKPWRTAAECIDWSIPCPSIFERARPLAEATCRRIAKGIMRYVVNCSDPFIVPLTHHDSSNRVTTMGDPVPTVTSAHRGEMALVAPVLTEHANAKHERNFSLEVPLRTQCAAVKGGHFALIAPMLVANTTGNPSKAAYDPLKTVATGGHHALVSAFLAKHYGGHETPGWPLQKPASTVTAVDHHALVTGCLVPRYGERATQEPRALDVKAPAPTIVPMGNGGSLVAAHLTKFRTGSTGSDCAEPVPTVTAGPKENPAGAPHALGMVAAHIEKMHGTSSGQPAREPIHTVSAQGQHFAEVRAFLVKYYGNEKEGLDLKEPMHTTTTKDRFGLVTIHGEEYAITDIGLRMLWPRELFRAQGFPDDYIIGDDGRAGLRLTKSAQVRMCGNSVCPPLAAALVRANVPELSAWSGEELRQRMTQTPSTLIGKRPAQFHDCARGVRCWRLRSHGRGAVKLLVIGMGLGMLDRLECNAPRQRHGTGGFGERGTIIHCDINHAPRRGFANRKGGCK